MPSNFRWGSDESSDEEEHVLPTEQSSDDSPSDSPPPSSPDWSFEDDWEEKPPSESDSDISAIMVLEELHAAVTLDGEDEDEEDEDEDEDEGYVSDFDEEEEHRLRKRIKIWWSPSPSSSDPGSPSVGGENEEPPQNTGTTDDPIIIDE
jgi:hypothetical protein